MHSSRERILPLIPYDAAYPSLRFRSARRVSVVATSRPPTWLKQLTPSSVRDSSFSTVYLANRAMDLEGLVWKTSPGACEVEPPGMLRGPWSRTVMLFQPRVTSSSARLVPTMPAPIMTMRGDDSKGVSPAALRVMSAGGGCLPEHHGAGLVQQYAVLAVPADSAGEGQCFGVLAHGGQLRRA